MYNSQPRSTTSRKYYKYKFNKTNNQTSRLNKVLNKRGGVKL